MGKLELSIFKKAFKSGPGGGVSWKGLSRGQRFRSALKFAYSKEEWER